MEKTIPELNRDIQARELQLRNNEIAYRHYITVHPNIIPTDLLYKTVRETRELEKLYEQLFKLVS